MLGPRTRSPGSRPPLRPLRTTLPPDCAPGWRCSRRLASSRIAPPAVHPHDLALRDTNPHARRAHRAAARSGALEHGRRINPEGVADDHLVAQALAYARHWRRLAELATVRPLQSMQILPAPLAQLGAPLADDAATRAWLAALPGPTEGPGLLAAARVMTTGLPGIPRGEAAVLRRTASRIARDKFSATRAQRPAQHR